MLVRAFATHHVCHCLRRVGVWAGSALTSLVLLATVCLWSAPIRAQPTPPPETAPGGSAPADPQPGAEDPALPRPAVRPEPVRKRAAPRARPRPRPRPRRQASDTEDPAASPASRPTAATRTQTPSVGAAPDRPGSAQSKASPVVRAVAGNWGMFFRFGGLATLDHGNNTRSVDGLLLTQVGFRYVVTEKIIIPLYFSLGVRFIKPPDNTMDDTESWGMEFGTGIEYHFRIWRRISPFIAFNVGLGVIEPAGDANMTFGIGFGPAMGVEYYIGDRVSITVQYMMTLQIEIQQTPNGMGGADEYKTVQFSTIAGGALNITYYF
ncbi:MAG: hypothetical protein ABI333_25630 [bacterium]